MRIKLLIFIFLILHLGLLYTFSFTAWPEMLIRPYLMLKGYLPYKDFIMEHNPLLLFDIALFNGIFGTGLLQLKIYSWILIILTDIILFLVAKKLWNSKVALFSLTFYIPMQLIYDGNGLWFDLVLAPFVLLIFYLLREKKYFWSGVIFAFSFLIKQTAFWFIFPISFYFLVDLKKRNFNRINLLFSGFIIVILIFLTVLAFFGIAFHYFRWAIDYGIFILPKSQAVTRLPSIKEFLVYFSPYFIFIPFFILKKGKEKDLIFWSFFSLLGVFPRFELFHFQPSIPFISMVLGLVFFSYWKNKVIRLILMFYFTLFLILFGKIAAREWREEDRFWGENERKIALFVKSKVKEDEKIYVLNYWDSLYVMTNTLPAVKPLIPFLPWYLNYDNLKQSVINDLYLNMPRVIIKGDYNSFGLGSYMLPEIDVMIERYYSLSYKIDSVSVFLLNQ